MLDCESCPAFAATISIGALIESVAATARRKHSCDCECGKYHLLEKVFAANACKGTFCTAQGTGCYMQSNQRCRTCRINRKAWTGEPQSKRNPTGRNGQRCDGSSVDIDTAGRTGDVISPGYTWPGVTVAQYTDINTSVAISQESSRTRCGRKHWIASFEKENLLWIYSLTLRG